jgi:hypothetical protein
VRVLVTASRDWADKDTLVSALSAVYLEWKKTAGQDTEFVVVQGGARGGDAMAEGWATAMATLDSRVRSETHPADWARYGRAAGHIRNQEMIDTGIDRTLAFPLGRSPGTRGCMRLAKKAGVPVKQYAPRPW